MAGEVGEGIPDGGNSMSSRTGEITIQQQREPHVSVPGGRGRMPPGRSGESKGWGLSYQCSGCLPPQRV